MCVCVCVCVRERGWCRKVWKRAAGCAFHRKLSVYPTGSGKALKTHETAGSRVREFEINFWKPEEADSQVTLTVTQSKVREEWA